MDSLIIAGVHECRVRKCERGNGGMGTGIAATGTERERDSVLRERDGSGT